MTIKVYAANENVFRRRINKSCVVKQLTPNQILTSSPSQNDGLKGALGKVITKECKIKAGTEVIMGFTIKFEAELESVNENEIKLTSHGLYIFIKWNDTKRIWNKKTRYYSTSYLKKSSFEKLNTLTFGNALGFSKEDKYSAKIYSVFLGRGNQRWRLSLFYFLFQLALADDSQLENCYKTPCWLFFVKENIAPKTRKRIKY